MIRKVKVPLLLILTLFYVSCAESRLGLDPSDPNTPLIQAALSLNKAASGVGVYQATVIQTKEEGWLTLEQAQDLLRPMFEVNELILRGDVLLRILNTKEPPYDLGQVQNILTVILGLLEPPATFIPATHRESFLELLTTVRQTVRVTQQLMELANVGE